MKKICFWSVGDGEYAIMLQNLVHSFREVGMEEDFIAFSDRPIQGATQTIITPSFDKKFYLFKFSFLKWFINQNYDYVVFLDSDNFFVRHTPNLLELMNDTPIHTFFECDLSYPAERKTWWECPLEKYVSMMHDCGITSEKVYNINGGFFIIKREAIQLVCELAQDFWTYAAEQGFLLTDEPPLAYAAQMLCGDIEKHLLKNHFDIWATDWTAQYKDRLPDGHEWIFKDYMRYNTFVINPAIVHALKSKKALISEGSKYLKRSNGLMIKK
ncbi:putative uncharacterized protein [Parachlamydia acanthamoebae UV-7]|uniref:Nucleotide-diphospho-sugar transferase domain-containing protein n=2 Tax=Parachlamydia acanthamoebae TaxID=83552 RepID=F8L2C5_PARAV|nr:hypothetical protein [Parachlamydia acanthamoebae]KIA76932.1 hypothetical protein DB43_HD00580 [Parachlamydia acanthamoebae]CCB87438.1 putative uncharacterized protein [Parachlamydia acanthamoebae UV-7]